MRVSLWAGHRDLRPRSGQPPRPTVAGVQAARPGLLPRWVAASVAGEVVGLGGTGLVGFAYLGYAGEPAAVGAVLAAFGVAVASGALEATVVGLLQHRAMRPWFPRLRAGRWWRATLWGALAAYGLGYLPSTVLGLAAAGGPQAAAPAEPPQWLVLAAAAGLGVVAGGVLAIAQALELRHHVQRAWRWLPANMLAWGAGMPLVFAGMDLAFRDRPAWLVAALVAATLALTGAVVGVVNGSFLTRMAPPTLQP